MWEQLDQMRLCTLIYTLGYNDHFIYFDLIFFTVAFFVMIIHYFWFLNVNVSKKHNNFFYHFFHDERVSFAVRNYLGSCDLKNNSNALNLSSGE